MAEYNFKKHLYDYLDEYNQREKERREYEMKYNPGEYKSQYGGYITGLMNEINNYQPFNYDYTKDKSYQAALAEQVRLGQRAMRDASAQAAALTGGYGNSYGATAASAAYNQHLQKATSMIPQFEELAYSKYMQGKQDKYSQLSMYQNADATDYGRYRDSVGDYQAMLNYYTGLADTAYNRGNDRYKTDYNNAYEMWRAQQADEQNARDYAEKVRQYNENMAFQREQYEYQKQQDAAQQAYNYAKLNNDSRISEYENTIDALQMELGQYRSRENAGKGKSMNPATEQSIKKEVNAIINKYKNSVAPPKMQQDELQALSKKYMEMGYSEDDVSEIIYSLMKNESKNSLQIKNVSW